MALLSLKCACRVLIAAVAALQMGASAAADPVASLQSWLSASRTDVGGPVIGPFNMRFSAGGVGLDRGVDPKAGILRAGEAWTLSLWLRIDTPVNGRIVVAALGDAAKAGPCRCLLLDSGRPALPVQGGILAASRPLTAGEWHAVGVRYDGALLSLFVDGHASGNAAAQIGGGAPTLQLAPAVQGEAHFGGSVAALMFRQGALAPAEIAALAGARLDFSMVTFTEVGSGWPWQVTSWRGLLVPQDAWTLPHAHSPADQPQATPVGAGAALLPLQDRAWALRRWRLAAAPRVGAAGAALALPGFDDRDWLAATVPGTVLTTMVDRGIYPDPDHGLNNLAIPDSLARQAYWYRTEFASPPEWQGAHLFLTFKGVNYAAEIWLNGVRLGMMRGAFLRGRFDVTGILRAGQMNALAVRVDPPPHPGIPHEESIAAGPGENGGNMAIDGPTFFATEGWDWIPGIRDRDTGLWQDVVIEAKHGAHILDPDITTRLDLPRTDTATIAVDVPVQNDLGTAQDAVLSVRFGDTVAERAIRLPPGSSTISFGPATDTAFTLYNPRLWWPNGYGAANLYDVEMTLRLGGAVADQRHLRTGVRELSYELSLFDRAGRLRRVEIDPAAARHEALIDTRHAAIKQTANGWAYSLTESGENAASVHDVARPSVQAPYLVIKVNGVPIAARGGSWGMDDSRKRVSRERLAPYFRLEREAGINIIRNWVGQDTEESFYDLADENGFLVLNDFWESTQDFQVEAEDPQLFLANAADVMARYRCHPSIAVWFGRNEGVPQPALNEGLAELNRTLDGTRLYMPSSNRINLADSGPYNYRDPDLYFSDLGQGFAVEIGTPSPSTLESIEATVPQADRWPISDTFAYHDWHFGGNGDIRFFMDALSRRFGAPSSLTDFDRKAQMLSYEAHRAIFEGMAAGLWTRNSARLLWMAHPAWPSNMWQMYSADTDTAGAYYGTKKALEKLHVQFDPIGSTVEVVNTTRSARTGLVVDSAILSLDGRVLVQREDPLDAKANVMTALPAIPVVHCEEQAGIVLVSLVLKDGAGTILSRNLYWRGRAEDDFRAMLDMKSQAVAVSMRRRSDGAEDEFVVRLTNRGTAPALAIKMTLLDMQGHRILPAYYDDNYISLLAGESREIAIRTPGRAGDAHVALRGWNVIESDTAVSHDRT